MVVWSTNKGGDKLYFLHVAGQGCTYTAPGKQKSLAQAGLGLTASQC